MQTMYVVFFRYFFNVSQFSITRLLCRFHDFMIAYMIEIKHQAVLMLQFLLPVYFRLYD